MISGKVFNIQRYSIEDGPGIRTTVFLKGCPLRCIWCSNPESQNLWLELVYRDSFCRRCGTCVQACPESAISFDDGGPGIDRQRCNNCGQCAEACPYGALEMAGQEMTVENVFEQVLRDLDYYLVSDGGVTVSGGEPLLQADFVAELFVKCRNEGIHTCLDTSGCASPKSLRKVLTHTDLVYYDIKHADSERHKEMTQRRNRLILHNLRQVVRAGVPVVIRIPVIPGLNASVEEIEATAQLLRSFGLSKVHLLPYHRYGMGKYKMLDREYPLKDIKPPTTAELENMVIVMQNYGVECEVRV